MKIVFLQPSSIVEAYRRLQAKSKMSFKHFASPKGLIFFLRIQAKKGEWGKSPP